MRANPTVTGYSSPPIPPRLGDNPVLLALKRDHKEWKALKVGDLPASKMNQLNLHFEDVDSTMQSAQKKLEKKANFRLSTVAEWRFQKWAEDARLECKDLNEVNLYGEHDYCVNGVLVDVKSTESWFWAHEKPGEIIVGVTSQAVPRQAKNSDWLLRDRGSDAERASQSAHRLEGIFDASAYAQVPFRTKYFDIEAEDINPCYFHSLDQYFHVNRGGTRNLNSRSSAESRRGCLQSLQSCHADLRNIVEHLEALNLCHLGPYYLADHLMDRIEGALPIDEAAIRQVRAFFQCTSGQRQFLNRLIKAKRELEVSGLNNSIAIWHALVRNGVKKAS